MNVKGTAFLARKVLLVEDVGEERYSEFLAAFAQREPIFAGQITATSVIPLSTFISFNEAIVEEFYGGDPRSYVRFGEKSAEYSLTIGPYKRIGDTRSLAVFAQSARVVYQAYFTEGWAEGALHGTTADLILHGVLPEHRHIYLEYVSTGYFRRGMEIVSLHGVAMERVLGFSKGDEIVHYRFAIEPTAAPAPFGHRHL